MISLHCHKIICKSRIEIDLHEHNQHMARMRDWTLRARHVFSMKSLFTNYQLFEQTGTSSFMFILAFSSPKIFQMDLHLYNSAYVKLSQNIFP